MKKKFKMMWYSILVLFIALLPMPFTQIHAEEESVVILHTNDMHGAVQSSYSDSTFTTIGLDEVSALKKKDDAILIDAGDATQGSALATYSKGSAMISLMNQAGYDGMTLGNHEFDYGQQQLLDNVKAADFPVVSANVYKGEQPFLKNANAKTENGEHFVIDKHGIKIGFFGITTQETAYKTSPKNTQGLTFKDEINISKQQVTQLKQQGVDVVIGIMHVGIEEHSSIKSSDIAASIGKQAGLDAIIDGHSHSLDQEMVNGVLIQQTKNSSTNIGEMKIQKDENGTYVVSGTLLSGKDVHETPDEAVTTLYNTLYGNIKEIMQEPVGRCSDTLYGGWYEDMGVTRIQETNLGNLIADAMTWEAKDMVSNRNEYKNVPIVALENGGGIRATIEAGEITKEDIYNVLPFGNLLSVKEITPSVLYEILEHGISYQYDPNHELGESGLQGLSGAFPQISGMSFTYDVSKPVGSRIQSLYLQNKQGQNTQKLSRKDTTTPLLIVINDFDASGGDGYTMLSSAKEIAQGSVLDVVLSDYIQLLCQKAQGTFSYPASMHRSIRIGNDAAYPNYSAHIDYGQANVKVAVTIDKTITKTFISDDKGILHVDNLKSVGHILTYRKDGKQIQRMVMDHQLAPTFAYQITQTIVKDDKTDYLNAYVKPHENITITPLQYKDYERTIYVDDKITSEKDIAFTDVVKNHTIRIVYQKGEDPTKPNTDSTNQTDPNAPSQPTKPNKGDANQSDSGNSSPSTKPNKGSINHVNTYDSSQPIPLYWGILMISLLMISIIIVRKHREKKAIK